MLNKKGLREYTGVVKELLPNMRFRVEVSTEDKTHELIAYASGKIQRHSINILCGDKVRVEVSPHDLSKGRLTFRERIQNPSPPPKKS